MMSFLFNFPDSTAGNNGTSQNGEAPTKELVVFKQCQEITADEVEEDTTIAHLEYSITDTVCLKCLDSRGIEAKLTASGESAITQAVQGHSDLVPNVYEGGLKVWEGAIDLVQYLNKCNYDLKGKCVLELGCGAGLPGLWALIKGAAQVHFQDYNEEVIHHYTIPNVHLNKGPEVTGSCRYFSGDWLSFVDKTEKDTTKFDVILTAETIYQPDNYGKLSAVFKQCLSDSGVVLVAAKSNYFGVGGGTRDFEEFIRRQGLFDLSTCHTIEEGVPREILKLTWRKT